MNSKNKLLLYPMPISWLPTKEPNQNFDYTEQGQKYLVFFLKFSIFFDNKKEFFTFLIVPDDSSILANEVKKFREKFGRENMNVAKGEERKNCFATPFTNLKLIPNFINKKGLIKGNGLLVKDTSQAEKVLQPETSSMQITFKVISQQKKGHVIGTTYEESFSKYGSYNHELEIEPLNLIEGMAPITRIIFSFVELGPGRKPLPEWKDLTKSELYNAKILSDSVGKTFTMEVKMLWLKGEKVENNTLSFGSSDDYVFDSLTEIKANEKKNPAENNQKEKENSNKETNNKTAWILTSSFLGIGLCSILLIYWLWKRKFKS